MTTDGPASPPPAPAGASRSHRLRNLLIIVVGFFVTLGAVVGGAVYFLYDRGIGLDRSTPEIVTRQFLQAVLVEQDRNRVSLFVCNDWSAAEAMDAATEAMAIVNPPKETVTANWGITAVEKTDKEAVIDVTLQFSVTFDDRVVSDIQSWTLHLRDQDGWRVCSLTKNGSLNP